MPFFLRIILFTIYSLYQALYGFGAAADVTLYLPLLRNVMTWLTAGGASYKTLKAGLSKAREYQPAVIVCILLWLCILHCQIPFPTETTPLHSLIHAYIRTYIQPIQGIAQAANAMGRTPRHLYILPGGVAEIHTSMPGKNTIVFKNRHGIIRLSVR